MFRDVQTWRVFDSYSQILEARKNVKTKHVLENHGQFDRTSSRSEEKLSTRPDFFFEAINVSVRKRNSSYGIVTLGKIQFAIADREENSMKWQKRREKDEKKGGKNSEPSPSTKAKDKLIPDWTSLYSA